MAFMRTTKCVVAAIAQFCSQKSIELSAFDRLANKSTELNFGSKLFRSTVCSPCGLKTCGIISLMVSKGSNTRKKSSERGVKTSKLQS